MMQVESAYILLEELHFHAFHGVMPQESKVGGDFLLTLRLGYDITKAMQTDRVEDTLKAEMEKPSALLEHVAGRIADALAARFPQVTTIDLALVKKNPPMGADCKGAGVELHLINDKTKQ